MRCGALQVRGSLDASGAGGESRSKSPRRTSCFLEVPTDPMFRSRSRSLDDGTRVRVPPSDCEATYRIYDEIVKEGKSVCVLSAATLRRHSYDLHSRVPRKHCCLTSGAWSKARPWFPAAVVKNTIYSLSTLSSECNNISELDIVLRVLYPFLWSQFFCCEIYFSRTLSRIPETLQPPVIGFSCRFAASVLKH